MKDSSNMYFPPVDSTDRAESTASFSSFGHEVRRYSPASSPEAKLQDEYMTQSRRHRDASISNQTMLTKIQNDIQEILLECKEKGWDGYNAKPISQKSAQHSFEFIKKLDRVPLPDLSPEPNGELGMLWEKNGSTLVISISDEKQIAYAEVTSSGSLFGTFTFTYDIPCRIKIFLQSYKQ